MNQFLSYADVSDVSTLVQQARQYQQYPYAHADRWKGKRLGLIFFNPSLRTRLSSQIAAENLGMHTWSVNAKQDLWNLEFELHKCMDGDTQEHIIDSIRVMSRYADILGVRTFPSLKDQRADDSEQVLQLIATHSQVPLMSLESATRHPLQSLADLLTITDHAKVLGRKPRVVLSWAPHIKPIPQCVANSLAEWLGKSSMVDFAMTHPEGYALNPQLTKGIPTYHDQEKALKDADIVYVKNWSAYQPYGTCPPVNGEWMLNKARLENINPHLKVMHCLPVRRNVELCETLLDSPHSLVTTQANNRIFAAQAVLNSLLETQQKSNA